LAEEKDKKQQEIVEYVNDFPTEEEEKASQQAEAGFQRAQKKRELLRKIAKIAVILFIAVTLVWGIYAAFKSRSNNPQSTAAPKKTVNVPIPEGKDHVFVNDTNGIEENNTSTQIDESKGLAGQSENYKIKDIAVGGSSVVLAAETEILPIAVYDVRSETLFSRDQKDTKLLISWKTNKLARSDVSYSKSGSDERTLKENSYGFTHALVISKMDQATRYSFVIDANDRGNSHTKSDEFVVYTGNKNVSVFELISNELDSMFGWAIKK
jgi:hypothetical protein